MTVTIVGAQLGDEGKGALVDLWGGAADMVVRYQGGDNAGHTVVDGETTYKLSLVPSGAVRGKVGVLGNGCVINPATLFDEIDALRSQGVEPEVRVAERAHVILPYHRVLDGLEEDRKADDALHAGTTGRGIGPAYEDKAGRRGIRIGDLLDPEVLADRLHYVVDYKRAIARDVFGLELTEAFDEDHLFDLLLGYGERLDAEGMPVDAGTFIQDALDRGEQVLFEGAQGTSIDIDHGIYPYVTSSNPSAGGAVSGTGVGPAVIGGGEMVGIVKAYLSRVGTGPLPTEMDGEDTDLADEIREVGGEFGTVTGRPRRIGWLDLPMLRHAARTSSFTGVAINHLDVLAELETVRVATGYLLDGEELATVPPTTERWARCEPIYREFEPWPGTDWDAVARRGYASLPSAAATYVEYICDALSVLVYAVGVGPKRSQTIMVEHPFHL